MKLEIYDLQDAVGTISYAPVEMLVANQLFMLWNSTETMILVVASNAFNCLNRQLILLTHPH